MNNLKTAFIVVLLLGGLYFAYQFLNHRDVPPPREAQLQMEQGIEPPNIEFGGPGDFAPVPVNVPAGPTSEASPMPPEPTASGRFSPASTGNVPSFAVAPSTDSPAFDPVPSTTPSLRTENTAVRPAEHATPTDLPAVESEPVGEPVKVATRDAGAGSRYKSDSIPNVQPNPFYRPDPKSSTASAGAGSIASPEVGKQANRAAFQRAWNEARDQVDRGKFPEALAALTVFYDHPDLTETEQKQLQKTLDSLAGRVIYSTEIYPTDNDIAQSHTVRTDETLMDIAARHDTQWQLLQNINGVRDPLVLIPRSKIKVIHGKFRAEVSIPKRSLTLFIDKYYAGRFVCSFGLDPMPAPGTYTIRDKREGRDYYPKQGRTIAALRPDNPYGGHWMDLGNELCIHGSAEKLRPEMEQAAADWGCISLAPRDAADVYGILSLGSTVTIK